MKVVVGLHGMVNFYMSSLVSNPVADRGIENHR